MKVPLNSKTGILNSGEKIGTSFPCSAWRPHQAGRGGGAASTLQSRDSMLLLTGVVAFQRSRPIGPVNSVLFGLGLRLRLLF